MDNKEPSIVHLVGNFVHSFAAGAAGRSGRITFESDLELVEGVFEFSRDNCLDFALPLVQ